MAMIDKLFSPVRVNNMCSWATNRIQLECLINELNGMELCLQFIQADVNFYH